MTQSSNPKRFRVALSFRGEYRSRVEKVAQARHDAEFALPNLDRHLTHLYRNESDLLVFFLCQAHATKPRTGLEWSVALDLVQLHHHRSSGADPQVCGRRPPRPSGSAHLFAESLHS